LGRRDAAPSSQFKKSTMNQKTIQEMGATEYRRAKAQLLGTGEWIADEGEDVRDLEPRDYEAAKQRYFRSLQS
jgi:hypothetical protein